MNFLETIEAVRRAASNPAARLFAIKSVEVTLHDLGFPRGFFREVADFITLLGTSSSPTLCWESVHAITKRHPKLLHSCYDKGFGRFRRQYALRHLNFDRPLETCLDWGCGPAHVADSLLALDKVRKVIGVDVVPYREHWQYLETRWGRRIEFHVISPAQQAHFISKNAKIDLVLLIWALHHATVSHVDALLNALRNSVSFHAYAVVFEDAAAESSSPIEDPFGFHDRWRDLEGTIDRDGFRASDHAHVILDFIANVILARYSSVCLPVHYRCLEDWKALFSRNGWEIERAEYVGFPRGRDIAVPQSVLRCQRL